MVGFVGKCRCAVRSLPNFKSLANLNGETKYRFQKKSYICLTFFYLHRDYLGSVLAITDQNAHLVERRQFGAWGTIDKFWNSTGDTEFNYYTTLLDRGYTGHEHLFFVSLINMNGRLYDAKLGRFLSPDNFVQDPFSTQSFNRYGYVVNNPLSYVDESGEFIHLIIGAVIGGIMNWAMNGAEFTWKGLGHFFVGAVAGALGAGVGAGVSSAIAGGTFGAGFMGTTAAMTATSSFFTGVAIGASGGFSGGFVSGFGNGLLNGQNFGDALVNGFRDGGIGAVTGGLIGGVASGIDAAIDGRRFFDGAKVTDISLVDQANPYVPQSTDNNCVAACGESSTNGRVTQSQIRSNVRSGADGGLYDGEAVKYVAKVDGGRAINHNPGSAFDKTSIVDKMSKNTKIFANLNLETRHEVLLNKVVERNIQKISGKIINKVLYYVMDPLKEQYSKISFQVLENSNIWYLYP